VGQIFVTDSIELQPKCRIDGDVHYKRLEMHAGAVVNGRLLRGASKLRQEEQLESRLAAVR
jgi:cytoskeletal protein CcmA (bactofilin family)